MFLKLLLRNRLEWQTNNLKLHNNGSLVLFIRISGASCRKLPGKSGDFPEARGSLTPSEQLAKFVSIGNFFRAAEAHSKATPERP